MLQAAVSGLDLMDAWDLTPGELIDYIEVFRRRMEIQSYWGYNLAQCIASMVLSSSRPKPCDAFPGWIPREEMTDEEMYANCLAWCGGSEWKQDG